MSTSTPHTPWPRVIVTALGACLIVGVVLLGFAWPSVTAEPKDLPVGVVGASEQVDQIEDAIDEKAGGAVALTEYDDRAAAVDAIESREIYGAIVLGAEPTDAPEVLTASAAGAAPAQLLQGLATGLQAQIDAQIRASVEAGVQKAAAAAAAGPEAAAAAAGALADFHIPAVEVTVTDVVPLADTDPRGTGLATAMFPLILGGMMGAIIMCFAVTGAARRFTGVVLYSAGAGLLLTGILQGLFGALQGDYLQNSAAVALSIAAVSAPIIGLYSLMGTPGIGIGAAFTMLVANPLSSATQPFQFLLAPWGAFGQALAPGAAGTLLRSLSYFPNADASAQWLTLSAWAAGGLLLIALSALRRPKTDATAVASEAMAPEPVTV